MTKINLQDKTIKYQGKKSINLNLRPGNKKAGVANKYDRVICDSLLELYLKKYHCEIDRE